MSLSFCRCLFLELVHKFDLRVLNITKHTNRVVITTTKTMSSSVLRRKQILAEWIKAPAALASAHAAPAAPAPAAPAAPASAVTQARSCTKYTTGTNKPLWAAHGCRGGPPHKNKIVCKPQFPEDQRPKKNKWSAKFRTSGSGFSCIHPECVDYAKIFPTKQGVQQHARKHYPPEYSCSCAGEWYLKTEYNQHFLVPCPTCDKFFMKGSLAGHIKSSH